MFFATGFETTAVATAAAVLRDPPANFFVLSAHKYIPPVMEIVAEMPDTRVEGFLAAGHAATITGWGVFEPFVERHQLPVVVAGFEPLDILAGLVKLVELIRDGNAAGREHVPALRHARQATCAAQEQLWRVFRPIGGRWRGIAHVPNGNLRLRDEWAHLDARRRFTIDLNALWDVAPPALVQQCICGDIMAGIKSPHRLPAVRQSTAFPTRRSAPAWSAAKAPADLAPVRRTSGSRSASRWRMSALDDRITMKYGAGGRAMRALISEVLHRRPRRAQCRATSASPRWTTAPRSGSATDGW